MPSGVGDQDEAGTEAHGSNSGQDALMHRTAKAIDLSPPLANRECRDDDRRDDEYPPTRGTQKTAEKPCCDCL